MSPRSNRLSDLLDMGPLDRDPHQSSKGIDEDLQVCPAEFFRQELMHHRVEIITIYLAGAINNLSRYDSVIIP